MVIVNHGTPVDLGIQVGGEIDDNSRSRDSSGSTNYKRPRDSEKHCNRTRNISLQRDSSKKRNTSRLRYSSRTRNRSLSIYSNNQSSRHTARDLSKYRNEHRDSTKSTGLKVTEGQNIEMRVREKKHHVQVQPDYRDTRKEHLMWRYSAPSYNNNVLVHNGPPILHQNNTHRLSVNVLTHQLGPRYEGQLMSDGGAHPPSDQSSSYSLTTISSHVSTDRRAVMDIIIIIIIYNTYIALYNKL